MAYLIKVLRMSTPYIHVLERELTKENVNYVNEYGETPLRTALRYYAKKSQCSSKFLLKLIELDNNPQRAYTGNYTALLYAFRFYSRCDHISSKVLMTLLEHESSILVPKPDWVNLRLLRDAFQFYRYNPKFNFFVFQKLYFISTKKAKRKYKVKYEYLLRREKRYPIVLYRNIKRMAFRQSLRKSIQDRKTGI